METIKPFLKNLIDEAVGMSLTFKRNLLKDYIQIVVLDFLYSNPQYNRLVFYGGSCLRHCFELPRLSEDLNFVDLKKNIHLSELARDLGDYFKKNTDLETKVMVQPSRVKLKFPILKELGLAGPSDSDILLLKIEVFKYFDFCFGFEINIAPVFKFNRSMLVKTFDLPTLMATKIRAILHRKWEKTDKKGRTIAKVKGRDYFDLMWYLEKGIMPNFGCIEGIAGKKEFRENLLKEIVKVDARSIRLDLEPLIDNPGLVENLSKNIKEILRRMITNIK